MYSYFFGDERESQTLYRKINFLLVIMKKNPLCCSSEEFLFPILHPSSLQPSLLITATMCQAPNIYYLQFFQLPCQVNIIAYTDEETG